LLTQAGGQLRVAIVMAKLNIDRASAVAKLSAANNSLRDVIG
jgi:N-acetylmuramic acid 6-phosphate (MurNAc-6-P) etherase